MSETIGVTRVAELENILAEILDAWQREELIPELGADTDTITELSDLFDRAMTCCAREEDEEGY